MNNQTIKHNRQWIDGLRSLRGGLTLVLLCSLLAAGVTSCDAEYTTYEGPDYVMFADSLNICPVFEDNNVCRVALSAMRTAPYDRTFGIEVLQSESNAIEGKHYRLKSNTVTIPAGQLATAVEINGIYENIANTDSLNIRMRIVSLEDVEWKYYGLETNVRLKKVCPFHIENFTRYAVVQSTFLTQYTYNRQRLVFCEQVEDEENTIVVHDLFTDGRDLHITFDNSDPMEPTASVRSGDIVGTTEEFLRYTYGDNMLRITDYTAIPSTFSTCQNTVVLYSIIYVKGVGTLGAYATVIKWVSDAEAEDILHNGF